MCRNWKFWAVLAVLAAGIVAFTPVSVSTVVPLLVLAACPLMMVVAGGILARGARGAQHHPANGESSPASIEHALRERHERVAERDRMEALR